ncbi:uncharacterized protein CC84DRAFT_1143174 [Paraphaeosphaeria sporulosa]|uniref:Intramembrane protease 2 n=1 Tax=Paraphaeosphaeria sporulosa TaxID=1460663 RepID=A0A177CI76_9PLEO|nr:uncharacterized protein CC84DRAFT_1143174 [Paraphaeosphaeria sporulosa]OAG06961.1 hypothetical protein CC84DRAFT_1143174 [Paraphaeosphaeria sporulosa]
MEEPSLWARVLGQAAHQFTQIQPMIPTYAHLIASALFPIYAGAHASLTRPSSAAKPTKRTSKLDGQDPDDDDEEEEEHKMEGLSPTDAIMMPLFAGCALAGLYFLLKWLKDPHYLNLVLNWYFALFGVFAVSRLVTDALDIGHSLVYPRRFARGGALYHVDQTHQAAVPVAGDIKDKNQLLSPLPGFLSYIPLTDGFRKLLWSDRAMPGNKWTLRLYIHRLFAGKLLLGPHGMVGAVVSVAVWGYFNFVDKPWYLTNLIGFGFSYAALQLMSPTTFATGSLILSALFFYDIYFVFFTPMMVTVAKSIDAPIKLVFPRPDSAVSDKPQYAMLGLGDVVLPGIMIGLALRFDLWIYYLRRQRRVQATDDSSELVEKPKYFSLAGRWSDHFWSHSFFGRPLWMHADKPEPPFTFPKTYFKASLTGYILGMFATLAVMHVWGHAQPALLYLVPGVLGSLWLTALVRGELKLMWNFSEEDEEEAEGKEKTDEKDSSGNKTPRERESMFSMSDKKAEAREERMKKAIGKHLVVDSEDEGNDMETTKDKVKAVAGHRSRREVFSFSIEAPHDLNHPRSLMDSKKDRANEETNKTTQHEPRSAPTLTGKADEGHAGKRVRLT